MSKPTIYSILLLTTVLLGGCGQSPERVASTDGNDVEPSSQTDGAPAETSGDTTEPDDDSEEIIEPQTSEPEISQELRNELSQLSVFVNLGSEGWSIGANYVNDQDAALQAADQLSPWYSIEIGANATDEHLQLLGQHRGLQIVSIESNNRISDAGLAHLAKLTNLRDLTIQPAEKVTAAGITSLAPLTNLETLFLRDVALDEDSASVLENFTKLRSLTLINCNLTDAALASLANLTNLEYLAIDENNIGGEGLQHLSKLTKLRTLMLGYNETAQGARLDFNKHGKHITGLTNLESLGLSAIDLNDDGLAHVAHLTKLWSLDIDQTDVKGSGLVYLMRCKKLKLIEFYSPEFNGMGIQHLAKCKELRRLDLKYTAVGDDALREIAKIQQLTELILPPYGYLYGEKFWQDLHSDDLTDEGLIEVAKLKNLKRLRISGGGITDRGMKSLAGLSNLSHLALEVLPNVKGECLEELSALTQVTELDLADTGVTDENLQHLAEFNNVTNLHLPKDASDAALDSVVGLSKLQFLYIGKKISQEAIDKLKKAKPKLMVIQ